MSWQPPKAYTNRPVAILGAGVLGRRIACTWASAGYHVNVRDPSAEQRSQCTQYVAENISTYESATVSTKTGTVQVFEDLEPTVANAWLVIEAVPEKIELKISTFAILDSLAPNDCILATNSSSYKSSEMIKDVSEPTKQRICNTHYYMPPACMVVEIMTDGHTEQAIFPFLVDRLKETAAVPYVVRKESTGLIFNRLWAAVKRETLMILSEGVSVPEEIDGIFDEVFIKRQTLPCRMMDDVGLDTVALIESHYVAERGLSPEHTVDYLTTNFLDHGKLGKKSKAGGLYPLSTKAETCNRQNSSERTLLVLDLGLSTDNPTMTSGQVLQLTADGKNIKTLVTQQSLPDGIDIDHTSGRIFWTVMGIPGKRDGAVYSANQDGSDIHAVIATGTINTPKQLCLDTSAQKVYFSDREGCAVYRSNYDGSALEALVQNSTPSSTENDQDHVLDWCVGIAVSPARGKFYWTQKGPSKGGKGRIFCADITTPQGQTVKARTDIRCLFADLPEPIDLEIDETNNKLYWTDRGEIPWGNSLNRVALDTEGIPIPEHATLAPKPQVLTRRFNEAIGLKLDGKNGRVYVTDLGGRIYSCDMNGEDKRTVYSDESRAFTGITLV